MPVGPIARLGLLAGVVGPALFVLSFPGTDQAADKINGYPPGSPDPGQSR